MDISLLYRSGKVLSSGYRWDDQSARVSDSLFVVVVSSDSSVVVVSSSKSSLTVVVSALRMSLL